MSLFVKTLYATDCGNTCFREEFPSLGLIPPFPTSCSGSSIYRYTSIRSTWRIKDGSRLTEGNQSNSTFLRTSQRIRIFIVNLFVVMIYLQNYSNRATRYFYYEKKIKYNKFVNLFFGISYLTVKNYITFGIWFNPKLTYSFDSGQ